jgi:hypothetical protein
MGSKGEDHKRRGDSEEEEEAEEKTVDGGINVESGKNSVQC